MKALIMCAWCTISLCATATAQVKVIPVVVHIIHNPDWKDDPDNENEPDDPQNISDAQILTQINALNEDFRQMAGTPGKSDNTLAADMQLEFRLADTDPSGLATTGITRTEMSNNAFTYRETSMMHSSLGGVDAWDPSVYLNIWVCNLNLRSSDPNSPGLSGYAFFPNSISDPGLSAPSDDEYGVVLDYRLFGDDIGSVWNQNDFYIYGDICTHEVGHYLGLYHPFEMQPGQANQCDNSPCTTKGDKVCDTPPPARHAGTKICSLDPTYLHQFSTLFGCSPYLADELSQVENYMDYACDDSRNMFTSGQKSRVDDFLANDDLLTTVPNSNGFQNSTKDFTLFGDHDNNKRMDATRDDISLREYDYNSTAPIVTVSSSPYSPMTVRGVSAALFDEREEGVIMNMRSRSEVHLQDGFFAESHCEFHAWIDDALPDPPSKRTTPRNNPQTVVSIIKDVLLYPNPTPGSLGVQLSLSVEAQVDLSVYDVLGNHIERLLLGAECIAGDNTFSFNLSHLAPGTYYARLRAGNSLLTKKFVVVR